jgi:hypothetical protein
MNNTAMMSEVGMAERRWMKWGLVFLCRRYRKNLDAILTP